MTFATRKTSESNGRIIKLAFEEDQARLRFSDVLRLLIESADFRSHLIAELAAAPFEAYRWKTPGVTVSSVAQNFECVVLDSPGLGKNPADGELHYVAEKFANGGEGTMTGALQPIENQLFPAVSSVKSVTQPSNATWFNPFLRELCG